MRRTKGGARFWARWSTLALIAGISGALVLRSNVALLSTQGSSMAPRFSTGDLAVTVAASDYHVGDIVAYRSEPGGQMVLHRIIEHTGDQYRFKGDNNDWVDPFAADRKDLVGKLWLHIPRAGSLIQLRSRSWQIAMIVLASILLVGGSTAHRRRRRRRRSDDDEPARPPRRPTELGDVTAALALPGIATFVCLVLAVVSFARPVSSETTTSRNYEQRVRFGYTAAAPSGTTYPDGVVSTGAPIFLKLVSSLTFQVTYDVQSRDGHVHNAGGTYSIDAVVDGPNSWRRTIPLQPTTQFIGETFSSEVVVDIPQLRSIVAATAAETGVKAEALVVRIVPTIATNGFIDGAPFSTSFAKGLTMEVGPTTVSLTTQPTKASSTPSDGSTMPGASPTEATSGAGATPDQLTATADGKYSAPTTRANRFELFSRRLDVSRARLMSGMALALSLAWFGAASIVQDRLRHRPEATRIAHRYREKIVDVRRLTPADHVVEVASIAALVRIAEQSERFILHHSADGVDDILVDAEGTRYPYKSAGGPTVRPREVPDEAPPPTRPTPPAAPPPVTGTPETPPTSAPTAAADPPSGVQPPIAVEPPDPPEPIVDADEPASMAGLLAACGWLSDAIHGSPVDVAPSAGTPPPYPPPPDAPQEPPPYMGPSPTVTPDVAPPVPPPNSLDDAIRLRPLSDAERDLLGVQAQVDTPPAVDARVDRIQRDDA